MNMSTHFGLKSKTSWHTEQRDTRQNVWSFREFPGARTILTLLKNHSLNCWSEAKTPKCSSTWPASPRLPGLLNIRNIHDSKPPLVFRGAKGVTMHYCPKPIASGPMATHSTKSGVSELVCHVSKLENNVTRRTFQHRNFKYFCSIPRVCVQHGTEWNDSQAQWNGFPSLSCHVCYALLSLRQRIDTFSHVLHAIARWGPVTHAGWALDLINTRTQITWFLVKEGDVMWFLLFCAWKLKNEILYFQIEKLQRNCAGLWLHEFQNTHGSVAETECETKNARHVHCSELELGLLLPKECGSVFTHAMPITSPWKCKSHATQEKSTLIGSLIYSDSTRY